MSYDLTPSDYYDEDGRRLSKAEREAVSAAKAHRRKIGDKVRRRGWMLDGLRHLTEFSMDQALTVDDYRQERAGSDRGRNLICAPFEEEFIRQARANQRDLGREWGL
jgi:hypothetical protein